MHLMLNIFLWKMFSITFYFGKCSASHFTLENVQHHILLWKMFSTNKMWCFALLCKNTFLHQIHFCIKYIFASNIFLQSIKCICNILLCKNAFDAKMLCFLLCKKQRCVHFVLQKCIWCKNAFDAKMHLMQKCIWCYPYILLVQKCIFANQNVRKRQNAFWLCKNAFDAKMHFGNASHFPKENVQLCKNAFDAKMLCFLLCKKQRCVHFVGAKMHFCKTKCYKCIWCQNAFWRTFSKGKCSAVQKCIFAYIFLWKMFSITFYKGKCSAQAQLCHKWLCKDVSKMFYFNFTQIERQKK